MSETILEMRNITKSFGKVIANKDVNLSLYPGEIHALLGENGAGKSTLMNILTGIYKPNSGSVFYKGKKVSIKSPRQAVDMGIGMVHQHFHLIPTLSVAENVFLYTSKCNFFLKRNDMEQQVQKYSQQYQLEVDPAAKVWQLSVGEQQRVEIIKLLYRGADILILDEPSAVLTAQEAKEMFHILRTMAAAGKSVIVISHKMSEVMEFADRITVLKGGSVEDTMLAADATIERMTKAIIGDRDQKQEKNNGSSRQKEEVLQVANLSVKNDKGLEAVKDVSFCVHRGEIFGIAGVAGNGQKEIAEALAGLRKIENGSVVVNGQDLTQLSAKKHIQSGVAFIPEDRLHMGLVPEMSMEENRILKQFDTSEYSKHSIIKKKYVKKMIQKESQSFEIKAAGGGTPVSFMSGGNQQKLLIAREISSNPDLLIAAYPVRGLDIGATESIHEILLEQCRRGAAVFLISEELDELFQMADRIGVMCDGKMVSVMERADADYDTIGRLMAGEER